MQKATKASATLGIESASVSTPAAPGAAATSTFFTHCLGRSARSNPRAAEGRGEDPSDGVGGRSTASCAPDEAIWNCFSRMATDRRILVTALLAAAGWPSACSAAPASPTGWDAYRRLDLLPMLRPGERALLASSYDRRGGNADGAGACIRMAAGRCVVAEHTGPGEVDSIWTTRARAGDVRRTGTIRIELDGRRVVDRQLASVVGGSLGAPFTFPVVATARQASGAVWIKAPMPFRKSMRISTSRPPGYMHVNYRAFDSADGVAGFDPSQTAGDVRAALRSGGRPLPEVAVEDAAGRNGLTVDGPGVIGPLRITLGRRPSSATLRDARVEMTFDGRRTVDAPLGELFGSGLPARVRSLLSSAETGGRFEMWWPMPFRSGAQVRVRGAGSSTVEASVSRAPRLPSALAAGTAGYFHATSRRGHTARGRPWRVMEAGGPGLLVGLSATLAGPRSQRHLEGDERIVADGSALRGTGTEDFFEGGFYWFFGPRSLPLVGSPAHLVRRRGCVEDCRSMYRWLLADAVPFTRSLRFTLEHGDRNRVAGTYSTTALWYAP